MKNIHCVKSDRIRSFSVPCFPALRRNQTRKTPNKDTFHAVIDSNFNTVRVGKSFIHFVEICWQPLLHFFTYYLCLSQLRYPRGTVVEFSQQSEFKLQQYY